ncbi:MAG: D-alanyl-D-alanine carboxypeptidase [Hyphomicrobiaceae bacterium]|nr:D-alanyl-D-alanine carboxypeptidase [Hyphomicrobiaceae bacterium]
MGAISLAPCPVKAGPAILFDAYNGQVLYAEDADDFWYPASLTKIMTAYLAFEAIKAGKLTLDQKISVSELANAQSPSKVGMPVGAELSVELALQALIVKSANDVAVMFAEAIAGSEPAFVELMNAKAQKLGMTKTRFVNPHGLPGPDQSTSARDLAKLARAIIRDLPEHAQYWAQPDMRIGNIRLRTHNALLRTFEGADGIKTGFTCDAGFNVVASATRDNRKLVAVVLGEPNGQQRAVRAAALLEHGFSTQGWKSLIGFSTVDSMAASADTRPLTSARSTVLAWSCGHRPKRVRVRKPGQPVAEIKQKVAAAKAKAAAGAAPAANKEAPVPAPTGSAPAPAAASRPAQVQPKQ